MARLGTQILEGNRTSRNPGSEYAFLAAVTGGTAAPTDLPACLDTLRVIDALYASAAAGGAAVEVVR